MIATEGTCIDEQSIAMSIYDITNTYVRQIANRSIANLHLAKWKDVYYTPSILKSSQLLIHCEDPVHPHDMAMMTIISQFIYI